MKPPSLSWSLFAVLLGSACAGIQPHPQYRALQNTGDPPRSRFLVLADTHFSTAFGSRAIRSNSDLIDDLVTSVAIRPPQMDLWGVRALEFALEKSNIDVPIIHLGDAGNVSCVGEMDRFVAAMRIAGRKWYMAPGNHDSLLMGNWAFDVTTQARDPGQSVTGWWDGECSPESIPMDKNRFIDRYLQGIGIAPDQFGAATPVAGANCFDVQLPAGLSLERLYVCKNQTSPYQSFFIQQVSLGADTTLILLDTTQYRLRPGLRRMAGTHGDLDENQLRVLNAWLQAERSRPGPRRAIILAGHHPLHDLGHRTISVLSKMLAENPIVAYLGAHTHDPTEARLHPIPGGSPQRFLEINFGSLLDWPMQFGFLSVTRASSGSFTLAVETRSAAEVCDGTSPDADRAFTAYRQGGYDRILLEELHNATSRVSNPGPELSLAQQECTAAPAPARQQLYHWGTELENVADAKVRTYELCQVRRASEAEARGPHPIIGRTAKESSRYVRFQPIGDAVRGGSASWLLSPMAVGGAGLAPR